MTELTDDDVLPLHERLALAHWRRTVTELYAQVRHAADAAHSTVALHFRQERDRLFREHPQTPLENALPFRVTAGEKNYLAGEP